LKHTLLVLALELLNEVVNETVVEALTTQVSVTGGGLNLEDTLFDHSQEGDIESSSTKIENEDVALAVDHFVKTISDSASGGLIDDTKDVHSRNGT
jgi:hypothetical protein